ncbi:MAG: TonB-dependent receptor [Pseudomonadota bacterium]
MHRYPASYRLSCQVARAHISLYTLAAAALLVPPAQAADASAPAETLLDTVLVTDTRLQDPPAGARQRSKAELAGATARTSDTARLLENIPGVSLYGAGGISSLPVVQGLADDRLRTQVDGMDLMTACPNHMNPALSYIDPSRVERVEVYAGIAPVSLGGDSIGGAIQVKAAPPRFAGEDEGLLALGEIGAFHRSNGKAKGYNASLELAGEQISLRYDQSLSESENYRAGADFKLPGLWQMLGENDIDEDEVAVSEYGGSLNQELGLGLKLAPGHLLQLGLGKQSLDYEGFPNQRMDMVASSPDAGNNYFLERDEPSNVNRVANLRYTGQFSTWDLDASLFHQRLRHHMDMIQDRFFGMYMPMDTEATTDGGMIKASLYLSDQDILRIGADFQRYRLDDWWPPIGVAGSMCCDDFWNIRDGKRDRVGLYGEWEAQWTPEWMSLLGLRGDRVKSDAGDVQGYNATYAGDAARFNAKDRSRTDHHLDFTALTRYTTSDTQTLEAGLARKTRSPNLYERYPWSTNSMAWVMNNFVGDGNGYIGNLDLKPETAYTLSLGADWHAPDKKRWNLKLTGHATHVKDFINAERCDASVSPLCNNTNSTTTNRFVLLQYVNHDARLAGIDLSGDLLLGEPEGLGSFTVAGMVSYVRGKDLDTGDSLYHIMPLNGKFSLVHTLGGWTSTAEWVVVAAKKRVSEVRNEIPTDGYALLNLRTSYAWKQVRLDLAVENVFDRYYVQPLGGVYIGQGNSMSVNAIPWGMGLPGMGRSVNVAVNVKF